MTNTIFLKRTVPANDTFVSKISSQAAQRAHVFVALHYTDSVGAPVTPTDGTFTIDINPIGMSTFIEIGMGTDVDATLPLCLLSYSANTDNLRYTPTGIVGADKVEISIQFNEV